VYDQTPNIGYTEAIQIYTVYIVIMLIIYKKYVCNLKLASHYNKI